MESRGGSRMISNHFENFRELKDIPENRRAAQGGAEYPRRKPILSSPCHLHERFFKQSAGQN
jgi:hypothetical protein